MCAFPTMLRIVLPSLSNAFISLFKDTSLASVIAVPELTFGANWIKTNTFRAVEVWIVVAGDVSGRRLDPARRAAAAGARADAGAPDMSRLQFVLKTLPFLWQGLLVTLWVSRWWSSSSRW